MKPIVPGFEHTATARFVRAFFDEMQRSGVSQICISPGSRSTPLTVAALRTPGLHCTVHLDERSAAFFALGQARVSRRPVALICTSGTAVANYLPAVIEACHSLVPLLVLSADRPAELRDCGAGQTIDQNKLYGDQVKHFVEVDSTAPGDLGLRYARTLACRSVAGALSCPAGVVHLNWPLREPFELDGEPGSDTAHPVDSAVGAEHLAGYGRHGGEPFVSVPIVEPKLDSSSIDGLVELVQRWPRGVIACGPLEPDSELRAAILALAQVTGWPILADPMSQLRCGPGTEGTPLLVTGDWLLADQALAARLQPDVVLHIGAPPVSKAQRLWLEANPPRHFLVVDPAAQWAQPGHLLSMLYRVMPLHFCQQVLARLVEPRFSDWRALWQEAERRVTGFLDRALTDGRESDPCAMHSAGVVRELSDLLPRHAVLWVSNSMPVRDLDAFLPTRAAPLSVYCNRGANGIDGVLSTALGAAALGPAGSGPTERGPTERGPTTLLIGDLALLHDIGALLSAHRLAIDLTIIVLNNDGGAIFSYLPVATVAQRDDFDEFFTVSHGLEFASAAQQFGLSYTRASDWQTFTESVQRSQREPGTRLIEVPVDASADRGYRRHLAGRMREIVAGLCPGDTGLGGDTVERG